MNDPIRAAEAAIEDAFREGFSSPATYNDTLLNDADSEWQKHKDSLLAPLAALRAALPGLREAGEPVAHVAEVHMSRYTLEWTNGPLPEGSPLYAAAPSPAPQGERAQGEVVALPKHETPEMHDAVMSLLYRGVARTETDLLWQAYRKALLAAPQTTEPAPEAGVVERAAFEGWASGNGGNIMRHFDDVERYASATVQGWWKAWKARAALAAQTANLRGTE